MADKYTEALNRLIDSLDSMSSDEFKKRHEASQSSEGPLVDDFFSNMYSKQPLSFGSTKMYSHTAITPTSESEKVHVVIGANFMKSDQYFFENTSLVDAA